MTLSELKKLKLIKKSADFSTFTAVIMEPNTVDAHGDVASADTVKKAAYDYFKNPNKISGINHEHVTNDIALVESYLLKNDTDFDGQIINKGAWLGEFEVNCPEKKEQILKGDFTGVSIGGKALTSDIRKSLAAKRNLDVVYIDEISLVDAPANKRPILQLNKSVDNKQGGTMTLDEILKCLEQDSDLLEKVEKALKDKKKEKSKKDEDDDNDEDDIEKSLSPKLLKRFQESQNRLIELEKKQENIEKKVFLDKTAELKKAKIKITESLSDSLYKISKAFPTEYKDIEKALFDAADAVKKSHYTKPVGEDVHEDVDMTEGDRMISVAKRLVKENPTMSLTQAYETVIKNKLHKQEN